MCRELRRQTSGQRTGRKSTGQAEAQPLKIGDTQRSTAPDVGPTIRAMFGDMPQGIGAGVAKLRRIGSGADAQRIQNENDCTHDRKFSET